MGWGTRPGQRDKQGAFKQGVFAIERGAFACETSLVVVAPTVRRHTRGDQQGVLALENSVFALEKGVFA